MLRHVRSLLAFGVFGFVGCGVGEDGPGNMPDAATPPPDTAAELKPLCTAGVTLTGTFTAAAELDPGLGCQPQGTWVVTATLSGQNTCSAVSLKSPYTYTLTGTGRDTKIAYTKATGEEFLGNVVATGSGGCEGGFEHILPDGGNFGQLSLHAFLPRPVAVGTELAITGTGEFQRWSQHP